MPLYTLYLLLNYWPLGELHTKQKYSSSFGGTSPMGIRTHRASGAERGAKARGVAQSIDCRYPLLLARDAQPEAPARLELSSSFFISLHPVHLVPLSFG